MRLSAVKKKQRPELLDKIQILEGETLKILGEQAEKESHGDED